MATHFQDELVCTFSSNDKPVEAILVNDNEHQTWFLSSLASNSVTVFQKNFEKDVLSFPSRVVNLCLWAQGGNQPACYILTQCGVWSYPVRHADGRQAPVAMETSQDVFSDLLQDTENPTQGASRTYPERTTESTTNSVKILDSLPGTKSLIVFNSTLLLLIQNDSDWLLSFYHILENGVMVRHQETRRLCSSTLTTVPHGDKTKMYLPKLYVMLPCSAKLNDRCSSNNTIRVSVHLFCHLFGVECGLSCLPVCLVTSETGLLYAEHLHPQNNGPAGGIPRVVMETSQPITAIFSLTVNLKQVLGDPKLTIQRVAPGTADDNCGNCLLVVGGHGKVHILLTLKSIGVKSKSCAKVLVRTCLVPGPFVWCADLYGNLLVHSTGREVYLTDLASTLQAMVEQSERLADCLPLPSQTQGLANVINISTQQSSSSTNGLETEVACLSVTMRGRVIRHLASFTRMTCARSHHSPDGSTLKDALTGISRVADLLASREKELKQQDQTIQQLHLASLVTTEIATRSHGNPVTTLHPGNQASSNVGDQDHSALQHVILDSTRSPLAISWDIQSALTSTSFLSYCFRLRVSVATVPICNGWSILVALCERPSTTGGRGEILSKVVHLGSLPPRGFITVSVSLDSMVSRVCRYPVTVDTQLMYTPPGGTPDQVPVCIPLPAISLQILHFMCPVNASHATHLSGVNDVIRRLARGRCCYGAHEHNEARPGGDEAGRSESLSCDVTIPAAWIKHHKLSSGGDVLHQLMKDYINVPSGCAMQLSTSDNHQVSLTVQSTEGSTYTICIQAEQRHFLAQIESCFKQKLKDCASVQARDAPCPSVVQVQAVLTKIQGVQREVRNLQEQSRNDQATINLLLHTHNTLKHIKL